MKRKWLFVLCAAVLVVATVLIWNSTAERRFFRQVQALQWNEDWAAESGSALLIDRLEWSGETQEITDPELQKAVFDAIAALRFEGKVQPRRGYRSEDEAWQIRLRGTEAGTVSIILIASEPESYDSRPRYVLFFDNDADIVLSGAEPLLEVVQTAFKLTVPAE